MNNYNKFIYYLTLVFLITYIYCVALRSYYVIYINHLFYILVGFGIVFLLTYIYGLFKRYFTLKKIDYIIFSIILISIISSIFAYDVSTAIFGEQLRRQGLLTLISMYSIVLCLSKIRKEFIVNLIYIFLILGFICNVFGYLQVFGYGYTKYFEIIEIISFFEHHNFYSSFIVINLSLASFLLLFDNKRKLLKLFFIITNIMALYLTNAVTGILCLFVIILIFLIFKQIKSLFLIFFISCILFVFNYYFVSDELFNHSMKIFSDFTNISIGEVTDDLGTGRIYIYKEMLKISSDNMLTGVGIDNFEYVNDGKILFNDLVGEVVYDSHNYFLNYLVTQGIFALILQIILYIFIFIGGFINRNNSLENKVLLYSILIMFLQMQFNASTIYVEVFYFVFLGLFISLINKEEVKL